MKPTRMTRRQLTLTEDQLARLQALSEATRVPAAVYIREGIDRVLELAETQMNTLDALTSQHWKPCAADDKLTKGEP
jgi:predicted DNA-binding protein